MINYTMIINKNNFFFPCFETSQTSIYLFVWVLSVFTFIVRTNKCRFKRVFIQ